MLPVVLPPPVSNVAAARKYRQRKRAGEPTRARRTAAELAALEAKPLEQRTAEEKEAVRNHRKELKRKEKRNAAPASIAPPPPTRSPSPPALQLPPLPPFVAPSSSDEQLHTQDLEDILGRMLSPSPPAAVAASPSPPAHPPPSSVSQVFNTPYDPFPPSLPSASPPPAAAAASTSAAAASAMSSASKLRSSILKKRASMSVLNPNMKRREVSKGIKIGKQDIEGEGAEQEEEKEEQEEAKEKQEVNGRPENEHDEWTQAVAIRLDSFLDRASGTAGKTFGQMPHSIITARIRTNIPAWAAAVRKQGRCIGVDDKHAPGCVDNFTPATWLGRKVIEFAHWPRFARHGDFQQTLGYRLRNDTVEEFAITLSKGRFLSAACHGLETTLHAKARGIARCRR